MSERTVVEKWVWNTPSQIVEAQISEKFNILIIVSCEKYYQFWIMSEVF